ncbi:unnamed protein product, partial [Timema podura]|nr:unnamed protein product [Timema podura]
QLEQYGVLRAWKAADYFGIILETDVDHLTKLAANFLTTKLSIDDGMELIRIQIPKINKPHSVLTAVVVEGRPCLLLNADTIPVSRSSTKKDDESLSDKEGSQQNIAREDLDYLPRKVGQMMSPLQWRSHLELLQSFSEAAEQAATGSGQMEVAGYSSALVAPGGRPFTLDTPTIVDIPDVDTNNMRRYVHTF